MMIGKGNGDMIARSATLVADNDEDDLDSVDADEDAEYEVFLEELYSPSD